MRKDPEGRKIGTRSIVEFVNNLLGVELREGPANTSKRRPGRYYPASRLLRTRTAGSARNFYEAGHALAEHLSMANPVWFQDRGEDIAAVSYTHLTLPTN